MFNLPLMSMPTNGVGFVNASIMATDAFKHARERIRNEIHVYQPDFSKTFNQEEYEEFMAKNIEKAKEIRAEYEEALAQELKEKSKSDDTTATTGTDVETPQKSNKKNIVNAGFTDQEKKNIEYLKQDIQKEIDKLNKEKADGYVEKVRDLKDVQEAIKTLSKEYNIANNPEAINKNVEEAKKVIENYFKTIANPSERQAKTKDALLRAFNDDSAKEAKTPTTVTPDVASSDGKAPATSQPAVTTPEAQVSTDNAEAGAPASKPSFGTTVISKAADKAEKQEKKENAEDKASIDEINNYFKNFKADTDISNGIMSLNPKETVEKCNLALNLIANEKEGVNLPASKILEIKHKAEDMLQKELAKSVLGMFDDDKSDDQQTANAVGLTPKQVEAFLRFGDFDKLVDMGHLADMDNNETAFAEIVERCKKLIKDKDSIDGEKIKTKSLNATTLTYLKGLYEMQLADERAKAIEKLEDKED